MLLRSMKLSIEPNTAVEPGCKYASQWCKVGWGANLK